MENQTRSKTVAAISTKTAAPAFRKREIRRPVPIAGKKRAMRLRHSAAPREVVVGILVRLNDAGIPLVEYRQNDLSAIMPARSIVAVTANQVGREVALMFENGDWHRPLVIGILEPPARAHRGAGEGQSPIAERSVVVESEGERLVIKAEREIVLRCGEASITLTRAGKILIRGTYIVSRASGANCVKGASIRLN
jgi:Domain of unknown function (DUF6484)